MDTLELIVTAVGEVVFYAFLAACALGFAGIVFGLAFAITGTL